MCLAYLLQTMRLSDALSYVRSKRPNARRRTCSLQVCLGVWVVLLDFRLNVQCF